MEPADRKAQLLAEWAAAMDDESADQAKRLVIAALAEAAERYLMRDLTWVLRSVSTGLRPEEVEDVTRPVLSLIENSAST